MEVAKRYAQYTSGARRMEWHRWVEPLGHTLCQAGFGEVDWVFSDRPPKRDATLCYWCWPIALPIADQNWDDIDRRIRAACRMQEYMTGRSG